MSSQNIKLVPKINEPEINNNTNIDNSKSSSVGTEIPKKENIKIQKISDVTAPDPKASQGYFIEKSEHGYLMATFTSSLKSHSIKIEIDISKKEILINTMNIQQHSPVELTLLLKNLVLEMKKLNIMYVVQQVTKSDWLTILRPQRFFSFVYENKQHGFITVKCPIDKFPEAVIHGLGFSDINSRKSKMQNHYEPDDDQN